MRRRYLGILLICLFGMTLADQATAKNQPEQTALWDFNVYLNNKKVGKHQFRVSETDGLTQVQSEARFKYSILLIPAFRYKHSAAEEWSDECLVRIESSTNTNGDRISVSGEKGESGFRIAGNESPADLPECVMTFAYWNPAFLNQSRLLNPQTGEYVDVTVEKVGEDALEVRGERVAASRYRLTANEIDMTLWYSTDDEWLALESVAKGGHVIRYELS